jgi:ATP-binding cassette subfamily B protein RaxB
MRAFDDLRFGFGSRLPLIMQGDPRECGMACVLMIAGFHGKRTTMESQRERTVFAPQGPTAAEIIKCANQLGMEGRPVRVELDGLSSLQLPCILQWSRTHFVVLKTVSRNGATVHDPARGVRRYSMRELSAQLHGVALELWPATNFKQAANEPLPGLSEVIGRLSGALRSSGQILLLATALELFTLPTPLFLQWVVDNVIASADSDLLTMLALGFASLLLMQTLISFVRSWAIVYLRATFNLQWRGNTLSHLLRLPATYFEKRSLGQVISRFDSLEQIQRTLTTSFLEGFLDGAFALLTLTIMFLYSPLLAWIVVLVAVLYTILRISWHHSVVDAWQAFFSLSAVQQSHFMESVRGIRTIKLFQKEEQRRLAWLSLLIDQINSSVRIDMLGVVFTGARALLVGLENVVVIWIGARMVIDGHFTVGALMAFNAYRIQCDTRFGALIDKVIETQLLRLHVSRLSDIVSAAPESLSGAARLRMHCAPTVAVADLRFRYSDNERYILDGVSFEIGGGESVAIVGPSGCGKTTLISIIAGILQPTEGDVLIEGESVRNLGVQAVRQMLGMVRQDDVLFAGSIAENISFFDPDPDVEWLEECARTAAIHADVRAMPMGYNSLVGDMGTSLSGGQKQRVLLARALYKRPKILILDEATSHLDVERESLVNEAVSSLKLTRIIVAHRPETIASADRQITLERGKIVERGSSARSRDLAASRAPASVGDLRAGGQA